MLRLAGIPIMEADVRTLIDLLMRSGRAEEIFAATLLQTALSRGSTLVALTLTERRAILGVLDDPPHELSELRSALLRELE